MKVIHDEPSPKRRRGRVRRLRNVAVFPTLLTLSNLLCGFAAIYFCMRGLYSADLDPALKATLNSRRLEEFLPTFISVGGFLIFLGMFFDLLDGRVARMTSGTTNFGGQLDSLADMITFGAAPALLMIGLVSVAAHNRGLGPPTGREAPAIVRADAGADDAADTTAPALPPGHFRPESMLFSSRGSWIAGAIYAACCALRLACYNVEHSESNPKQERTFRGLPSPGAAAVVASLVILYEHVVELKGWWLVNMLPIITIAAGLLMVSRIKYAHLGNRYLRGRKPFGLIIILLIVIGLLMRWPAPTLAAITCLYALTGPALWAYDRVRHRHDQGGTGVPQSPQQPQPQPQSQQPGGDAYGTRATP